MKKSHIILSGVGFFSELYLINTNQLFHISIIPEIIIKCKNERMKHISKIKLIWSYFDI